MVLVQVAFHCCIHEKICGAHLRFRLSFYAHMEFKSIYPKSNVHCTLDWPFRYIFDLSFIPLAVLPWIYSPTAWDRYCVCPNPSISLRMNNPLLSCAVLPCYQSNETASSSWTTVIHVGQRMFRNLLWLTASVGIWIWGDILSCLVSPVSKHPG